MKVILVQDVDDLGDKNDIKKVAAGYARNYLFPKGMAVPANVANLKQLEHRMKFEARRQKNIEQELVKMVDRIDKARIEITAHAGADGRLYGSVAGKHIAAALSEKLGVEFDKKRVRLEAPIKQVGEHEVSIALAQGKKVTVIVAVLPEGGEPVQPEAEEAGKEPEKKEATAEATAETEEKESEETAAERADEDAPSDEAGAEE